MRGSANPEHFAIRADDGKLTDPRLVIFPIFLAREGHPYQFLGTGFFITTFGWFVSAKHVFAAAGSAHGLHIVQFIDDTKYHVRPVLGYVGHPNADVAIGVCAEMKHKTAGHLLTNKVLSLDVRTPEVGDTVWTYAYPGTTVTQSEQQVIALNPNYYVGRVEELLPNGRDRTFLPGPCFRTSMVLHGGSSGGPVFAKPGHVVGVNSTGIDLPPGTDDVSFASWIGDIVPLAVPNVLDTRDSTNKTISIRELVAAGHVRCYGMQQVIS